jgi:hypothetical protein
VQIFLSSTLTNLLQCIASITGNSSVGILRMSFKVPEIKSLTFTYSEQCVITVSRLSLKIESFLALKNSKISCKSEGDILLFAVNYRYSSQSLHFSLSAHRPKLILGKIMENYLCRKYLLMKNGLNRKGSATEVSLCLNCRL